MATRPVEMKLAGLHVARAIEHVRRVRGLLRHQLVVTSLGTFLMPLLLPWQAHALARHTTVQPFTCVQEGLLV
ncbi:hypothetical protein ACFXP3_24375 [Streptomyces sp. NPDC059096]|uniref:hypothetical protein n=1 Tax=Streptomyces sp. NPDC059096 TaxID=3346727 RepID=UPI003685A7BB